MKFTFDWCVFGYPNNNDITEANSKCGDVCSGPSESAKSALVDRLLQTNATIQYTYCADGDGAFSKIADDCIKCLNKVPNAKTLANYVNALNVACDQQPRPGETLKLNFDVFSAVSALSSSTSTASASTASSAGTVTVTNTQAYSSPSSPAALTAASSSLAATSASAAASAKDSHDNKVRVGVGVGVGIGGAALISVITAIILLRRRSTRNREKFEGEARARWEAEYLAAHGASYNYHHNNDQEQKDGVAELSAPNHLAEADDGRPLGPELPSPETTSWSTSKTLRNSNYSMSRFLGRPAVPDKDVARDYRR
ncbi:hypothetical protein MMC07_006154 [Pseudocyphellaria aurata]|nr:hypothetical protein [Pseudocyphellaria aurata]